jgi:hypothetical protein
MEDPRRILEQAAERRVACEILPRNGGWSRGQLVRVEPGGVVVHAPDLRLSGGEDVRCWFTLDTIPRSFEASVIRTGVPVPDRSQFGVLLGFIDGWTTGERPSAGERGLDLSIVPPNGPGISLVHGPGRLVELSVDGLSFTLPAEHIMVFVEGAGTTLRFAMPGESEQEVGARVTSVLGGETHMLYHVEVLGIGDPEAYRQVVHALQRAAEARLPPAEV